MPHALSRATSPCCAAEPAQEDCGDGPWDHNYRVEGYCYYDACTSANGAVPQSRGCVVGCVDVPGQCEKEDVVCQSKAAGG